MTCLAAGAVMDSGGPGTLVQTYTTVTHKGGALALLQVTDRLRDLLVIIKLLPVFDCDDGELASLAGVAAKA